MRCVPERLHLPVPSGVVLMLTALIVVAYTIVIALAFHIVMQKRRQSALTIDALKRALIDCLQSAEELQADNEIYRWLLRCRDEDIARLTRENRDHVVSLSLVLTEMDRSA